MKNPKNGRDFNHSQLEGIPIGIATGIAIGQNPNVDPLEHLEHLADVWPHKKRNRFALKFAVPPMPGVQHDLGTEAEMFGDIKAIFVAGSLTDAVLWNENQ